jgi:hypothetical protein
VNTTTKPGFGQPAIIGGLALGVLSALPLIGPIGNVCCCLWVVGGGLIAAYLLQANRPAPITPADGLVVGLLAGLVGAAVHTAISIPLDLLLGPAERAMAQRFIDMAPPDVRDMFDRFGGGDRVTTGAFFIVGHIIGLMFWACIGAVFGSIGGVLGAVIFKKSTPPPGAIDVIPPAS